MIREIQVPAILRSNSTREVQKGSVPSLNSYDQTEDLDSYGNNLIDHYLVVNLADAASLTSLRVNLNEFGIMLDLFASKGSLRRSGRRLWSQMLRTELHFRRSRVPVVPLSTMECV